MDKYQFGTYPFRIYIGFHLVDKQIKPGTNKYR